MTKIRFPKGNQYRFWQDFRFQKGIPHDVDFDIEILSREGDELGARVRLRAPGYGYPYPEYGCGALYVSKGTVQLESKQDD